MIKKFSFFALATLLLLSIISVANATNIPQAVEPQNYPIVWTETVYNGSGSNIATGRIVEWDFATSDSNVNAYDNMCPWVKTVATDESVWTAGVTLTTVGINNGDVGQIIIKGPAVLENNANVVTAGQLVGSTNAGIVQDWTGGGSDEAQTGICIQADAAPQGYPAMVLIYVDPIPYSDN